MEQDLKMYAQTILGVAAILLCLIFYIIQHRRDSGKEWRRVNRKWASIYAGGVSLFILLPGILIQFGIMPLWAGGFFGFIYIVIFTPTVAKCDKELKASRTENPLKSTNDDLLLISQTLKK